MTGWEERWQQLAADEQLAALSAQATADIAAVHRRPVSLRRGAITGAEGVLRGAAASVTVDKDIVGAPTKEQVTSCYSLIAPEVHSATCRTILRAPAQVLARLDAVAGGEGRPVGAARLDLSILRGVHTTTLMGPILVHYELLRGAVFGPRSGLVGRVAQRALWVAHGADPAGLCVPEVYLVRHQRDYRQSVAKGDVRGFVEVNLRAMIAGAAEAEGIARAAS